MSTVPIRVIVVSTLAWAAAACGTPGMARSHDRTYARIFAAQRVQPEAGERSQPTPGLDSQEAGIVSRSYRKSLAPKGERVEEEPVLLLAPQGRDQKKGTAP